MRANLLPYADESFDVVIVSNALHIVPQPEKALQEIKRVLKDDGVLIAPTFTHAGNSFSGLPRAGGRRESGRLVLDASRAHPCDGRGAALG